MGCLTVIGYFLVFVVGGVLTCGILPAAVLLYWWLTNAGPDKPWLG
jgi:hypothetical protein